MFSIFKLGILFIIIVIVLFVIFSNIFRLASFFKVLSISIIIAVISFGIIISALYINDVGYELLGTSEDYITGEILSVSENKLRIRVIEHNLDNDLERNRTLDIRITKNTVFKKQIAILFEKSIELNEFESGDNINIICNQSKNNIVAQKVIVRY